VTSCIVISCVVVSCKSWIVL